MPGTLPEMQSLLLGQCVGRVACTDETKLYITPVSYTYNGKAIMGQTWEGMNLDILRKNPNVCFEVDAVSSMDNWKSVIVSGVFRELQGNDAETAREYLFDHVLTLMTGGAVHKHEHEQGGIVYDSNRIIPVMYKIEIEGKTGRFEKN